MKGGPSRAGIDPMRAPMRAKAAAYAESVMDEMVERLARAVDEGIAAGFTHNEMVSLACQVIALQGCLAVKLLEDRVAALSGGKIDPALLVDILLGDVRSRLVNAFSMEIDALRGRAHK